MFRGFFYGFLTNYFTKRRKFANFEGKNVEVGVAYRANYFTLGNSYQIRKTRTLLESTNICSTRPDLAHCGFSLWSASFILHNKNSQNISFTGHYTHK